MNKPVESSITLNISGVERETGLSKDVLRMWERRYGFPKPGRDVNGERQYTVVDIGKLRAVKRLMDVGLRPGKIMGLTIEELNAMADARMPSRRDAVAPAIRSESAQTKASRHTLIDGTPVHSFSTLMADLASIVRNTCRTPMATENTPSVEIPTTANPKQRRAIEVLQQIKV